MAEIYQWISWYQPTADERPLHDPPDARILGWWMTGIRMSDNAATLVALVHADFEGDAKSIIRVEWPEAVEWRFCNKLTPPFQLSNRFSLRGWAKERIEIAERERVENG